MTYADDELKRALRRVEPPAGFAERVIARATSRGFPELSPLRDPAPGASGRRMARWATAAALAFSVAGGMWYRGELSRQAEGEEAKRQVLLSLHIASDKLRHVQARVNAVGRTQP